MFATAFTLKAIHPNPEIHRVVKMRTMCHQQSVRQGWDL